MPHSNNSRRMLYRLVLFTLAGWALWALGSEGAKPGEAVAEPATETTSGARVGRGFSKRRLATSLAFATLFFAGAAFSAGAGDLTAGALESTTDAAAETTTDSGDPATAETAPAETAPAETVAADTVPAETATEPSDPASGSGDTQPVDPAANADPGSVDNGVQSKKSGGGSQGDPADGQSSDGGAAPASGNEGGTSGGGSDQPAQPDPPAAGPDSPSHAGDKTPPAPAQPSALETLAAHDAGVAAETANAFGTLWLNRTLPDPTPVARRLDHRFARTLARTAKNHGVSWALVLAVVRARGHYGPAPATPRELSSLSANLAKQRAASNAWQAVLGLYGRTAFADRVQALTRYNRAVGLRTLVRGLVASKTTLEHRVLSDRRIDIYAGGRTDISSGRVNVRVLALLRYLAEAHGQVTVSCLISGHRLYARPGVVSAHIYGEAVDISGLEGRPIYGNQEPGGLTERAVRNILLLPVELQPKQVISLLGLGGPSFPLADHYDHIHVGY